MLLSVGEKFTFQYRVSEIHTERSTCFGIVLQEPTASVDESVMAFRAQIIDGRTGKEQVTTWFHQNHQGRWVSGSMEVLVQNPISDSYTDELSIESQTYELPLPQRPSTRKQEPTQPS